MTATTPVFDFPGTTWSAGGRAREVEDTVESGAVLRFPRLAFTLNEDELRFLDPKWAGGRAKSISLL